MANNIPHVLLVEDDAFLAGIYKKNFDMDGFKVTIADNGDKGLTDAKTKKPDIILLDILLPKKDGFTVLEMLKKDKNTKNIPVIILTNLGQKEDVDRGMSLGAADYLIKSHFKPSEIVDKVKNMLKKEESKVGKKGFTLIEILVVVAVIALLATLSILALSSARVKARDSKRLADFQQMHEMLERYFIDHNAYPLHSGNLGVGQFSCLGKDGWQEAGSSCLNPYNVVPIPTDPNGGNYVYTSVNGSTYAISAVLEGTAGNLSGRIILTPSGVAGAR